MKRFAIAISVFVFALACLPHSIATAPREPAFYYRRLIKGAPVGDRSFAGWQTRAFTIGDVNWTPIRSLLKSM